MIKVCARSVVHCSSFMSPKMNAVFVSSSIIGLAGGPVPNIVTVKFVKVENLAGDTFVDALVLNVAYTDPKFTGCVAGHGFTDDPASKLQR